VKGEAAEWAQTLGFASAMVHWLQIKRSPAFQALVLPGNFLEHLSLRDAGGFATEMTNIISEFSSYVK
jgi:hypothetical protein